MFLTIAYFYAIYHGAMAEMAFVHSANYLSNIPGYTTLLHPRMQSTPGYRTCLAYARRVLIEVGSHSYHKQS